MGRAGPSDDSDTARARAAGHAPGQSRALSPSAIRGLTPG